MSCIINANTSSGLVNQADTSGTLQLQTASTNALYIDSSQNVGIGNTIPSSFDSTGNKLVIGTGSGNQGISIYAGTTAYSSINFANGTSGSSIYNGQITYYHSANALIFGTNGSTERMRIDSSGVLLVGTSSYNTGLTSTCKFQAQNNGSDFCGAFQNSASSAPYGVYVKYTNAAPNSTGSEFLYCADSSTLRASIRSNGGLANFSANNSNLSDERLKTDILPATTYLDKICSIPVVTFKYKDQTDEELNLGVIAQDVNKVAPELVDHNGFGETPEGESPYLAIYQTDLQYALMKCIQEQQTIINDLKARITALEGAK